MPVSLQDHLFNFFVGKKRLVIRPGPDLGQKFNIPFRSRNGGIVQPDHAPPKGFRECNDSPQHFRVSFRFPDDPFSQMLSLPLHSLMVWV